MKNKIIIEGEVNLIDKEAREWISKLHTQIETLNERTKRHTLEIKRLEKLK